MNTSLSDASAGQPAVSIPSCAGNLRLTTSDRRRVVPSRTDEPDGLLLCLYRRVAALGEFHCHWHPANRLVAARLALPLHAVQMVLAVEDKRFWIHPGVDPISIGRAALMGLLRKGRRQGGSTIPEQVIKLRLRAARPSTVLTRSYRAAMGIALVTLSGRIDILAEYLDRVYFGRTYFGIHSASEHYFRRSSAALTVSQSFFVADRIALPNTWRTARIANILRRQLVRDLLGPGLEELPAIYAHSFGQSAGDAVQHVVDSMTAR